MRYSAAITLCTAAALAAAALLAGPPAQAQERMALSDRVARLEQQAQGNAQVVDLLNRVNELTQEVQTLRGLIEQQNNELESLKKRQRDQYVDLDSRINRLTSAPAEGAAVDAPVDGAIVADGSGQPASVPADPDGGNTAEESGFAPADGAPEASDPQSESAPVAQVPVQSVRPDAAQEKALYDQAFGSLREGRYAESARRFQAFLEEYPNGDLADNAYYWLGESYYVTQNYKIALETFQTVLQRYPQSPKAADALLKVGYCQFELKDWPAAEATLTEVTRRYPDTTVYRLAEGRLRALRIESRK